MRRAFGLIAAIFFIVLVATTAITALSIATMTARDTNNAHNREQAVLLAQSATEYAVLAMQKHDYGINCLNSIAITYPNAADPLFIANVRIYYLDSKLGCGAGNTIGVIPLPGRPSNAALVDVTVTSTAALDSPQIRYHRRTIQKP
ncbi:type II secretion system protein [Campylobacter sp. VBCF_05 NA6]|uniref:type II secretion system protein n=1 Tax=unclassified Campylobacter TaxID=2593542 RepID=UPI0022E99EF8|nr:MULTISPECIES: type II secretion system protein [unclassified Campylobacter]MDA3057169.1 type II secretion system protein [Campylobacter sp. VBCF_04 NA7]MDA3059543.1 type II secretion system protein [Campylobacter sp. VBCF_05 NA6]